MTTDDSRLVAYLCRHPAVLPVVVAALVRLPALFGAFVYDDVPLVVEHPEISSSGFASAIWSRDYGLEFARKPKGYYRPAFMTLVFAIRSAFGPTPVVFHSFSLLGFLAATALVTVVAARASPGRCGLAVFTGVLYALHPGRVEVVSLVMSLPDLIVEIAALIVVLAVLRGEDTPRAAALASSSALCLLVAFVAALSKESAFFYLGPLAATLAIRGMCCRSHDTVRSSLAPAVGIAAGLAAALALRRLADIQSPLSIHASILNLLHTRSVPTLQTLGQAVKELIIPGPVVFWRKLPQGESTAAMLGLLLVLVWVGTWWAARVRSKREVDALLVAWVGGNVVCLMLLIAGGFAYSQRYLAVAPALILLCTMGDRVRAALERRFHGWHLRWVLLPVLVAYLALHGVFSLGGELQCWSPVGFFQAMHKANPDKVVPLGAFAQSLNDSGAPARDVEAQVRKATALDPAHPQVPRLHNMMVKRFLADSAFVAALKFSDWSLQFYPDDADKIALRAVALAGLKRFDDALEAIDRALTLTPGRQAYCRVRLQIQTSMNREKGEASATGTVPAPNPE